MKMFYSIRYLIVVVAILTTLASATPVDLPQSEPNDALISTATASPSELQTSATNPLETSTLAVSLDSSNAGTNESPSTEPPANPESPKSESLTNRDAESSSNVEQQDRDPTAAISALPTTTSVPLPEVPSTVAATYGGDADAAAAAEVTTLNSQPDPSATTGNSVDLQNVPVATTTTPSSSEPALIAEQPTERFMGVGVEKEVTTASGTEVPVEVATQAESSTVLPELVSTTEQSATAGTIQELDLTTTTTTASPAEVQHLEPSVTTVTAIEVPTTTVSAVENPATTGGSVDRPAMTTNAPSASVPEVPSTYVSAEGTSLTNSATSAPIEVLSSPTAPLLAEAASSTANSMPAEVPSSTANPMPAEVPGSPATPVLAAAPSTIVTEALSSPTNTVATITLPSSNAQPPAVETGVPSVASVTERSGSDVRAPCNHLAFNENEELHKVYREEITYKNGTVQGKVTYVRKENGDDRTTNTHFYSTDSITAPHLVISSVPAIAVLPNQLPAVQPAKTGNQPSPVANSNDQEPSGETHGQYQNHPVADLLNPQARWNPTTNSAQHQLHHQLLHQHQTNLHQHQTNLHAAHNHLFTMRAHLLSKLPLKVLFNNVRHEQ